MAEVTQLKRYDAPRINWGKWFLIGVGMLVSAFILVVPMPLHLYPGLQQRIDAGAGKPGEPGYAACYLADGDDCVDYRTGEPGVRYLAGLASDTFYLSGAPARC